MRHTRRSIEKVTRPHFLLATIALAATLYGCPQFALSGLLGPSIVDINLEEPATVVVSAGSTFQLELTGVTDEGEIANIGDIAWWDSSDSSVVSVLGDGNLYAAGPGEALVRAVVEGYADGITVVVATEGAPPAPSGLQVAESGLSTLDVRWDASALADTYAVYMDTIPGGGFTTMAYSGPNTSFTDSDLKPGEVRYYRVQASNSEGGSPLSAARWGRTYFNGDFELGDLSGWTLLDIDSPFYGMEVVPSGKVIPWYNQPISPIQGDFVALHGFEGAGPGTITLGADIDVGPSTQLRFQYSLGYDLALIPAILDRDFSVNIRLAGGAGLLDTALIHTATAGVEEPDTGWLTGTMDISSFVHTTVWVEFEWGVPENASGPAEFQLDDIRLE